MKNKDIDNLMKKEGVVKPDKKKDITKKNLAKIF